MKSEPKVSAIENASRTLSGYIVPADREKIKSERKKKVVAGFSVFHDLFKKCSFVLGAAVI
jgi:hypothetical protein